MQTNVREILDCVKYFLSPRPCLDSADSHGRRPDPISQEDHHARCLAGGAGAHLRAPRPPGGGTRADARQPPRRPGPALVLQVGDRPGDQPASPRAAVATGARGRRGHPRPGHYWIWSVADSGRGRAARHHRYAPHRAGLRPPPADQLLRLDQERDPDLAYHDRRRGHPTPGPPGLAAAGAPPPHPRPPPPPAPPPPL